MPSVPALVAPGPELREGQLRQLLEAAFLRDDALDFDAPFAFLLALDFEVRVEDAEGLKADVALHAGLPAARAGRNHGRAVRQPGRSLEPALL